ncbi:MAG: histone deacetylase, partial [Methanolinea sp.]
SVEGGLPYTNLGIVAALAGLPLENIREPAVYDDLFLRAYDPSAHRRVEATAEKLRALLSPHWACFS